MSEHLPFVLELMKQCGFNQIKTTYDKRRVYVDGYVEVITNGVTFTINKVSMTLDQFTEWLERYKYEGHLS